VFPTLGYSAPMSGASTEKERLSLQVNVGIVGILFHEDILISPAPTFV
jgi:hypothetical protein